MCVYLDNVEMPKNCHEGPCYDYTVMTNADRIRAMTDEELMSIFQNICCPYSLDMGGWKGSCKIKTKGCGNCWLDWLKQEADT